MADSNTRLVYSTDGEKAAQRDTQHKPRAQPQPQSEGRGVRLRLAGRAPDRVATLVSGLPGSEQQKAALLKQLKAACGAGGTLKDGVLELQGDHRGKGED